ncbi:MAG: tetratricopeptide repeat protein [Planctomycetes bacterium]|nr:tetratricopeptide repeat protein [Planctomycetota bacterium]
MHSSKLFSERAAELAGLAAENAAAGRHAEAEDIYRLLLHLEERTLGSEHTDIGVTLRRLAGACRSQGKHAEADRLLRRGQQILDRAHGQHRAELKTTIQGPLTYWRRTGEA